MPRGRVAITLDQRDDAADKPRIGGAGIERDRAIDQSAGPIHVIVQFHQGVGRLSEHRGIIGAGRDRALGHHQAFASMQFRIIRPVVENDETAATGSLPECGRKIRFERQGAVQ